MPNDGSFQIFTARFRVWNPTDVVNAITFGRTVYARTIYTAEKATWTVRGSARSIGPVSWICSNYAVGGSARMPRTQYPERYNPPVLTANLFLMPYSCNSLRTHYKSRTGTIGYLVWSAAVLEFIVAICLFLEISPRFCKSADIN